MAYITQEQKKEIAAKLKVALKDSGLKYSLSINNHSTICMTVKSAPLDFIQNYRDVTGSKDKFDDLRVNEFWYHTQFDGKCKDIIEKILQILNDGNFDYSDSQSDYFHVGWYTNLSFGSWNKPFVVK